MGKDLRAQETAGAGRWPARLERRQIEVIARAPAQKGRENTYCHACKVLPIHLRGGDR